MIGIPDTVADLAAHWGGLLVELIGGDHAFGSRVPPERILASWMVDLPLPRTVLYDAPLDVYTTAVYVPMIPRRYDFELCAGGDVDLRGGDSLMITVHRL